MKFTFQPLRSALALGFLMTSALVSGCDVSLKVEAKSGGSIAFGDPVIRVPMADRPTAGYFKLDYHFGTKDRIISVSSPAFKRVEMHDSVTEGGMKKMTKLESLDVPANSSISFAPGGKHLMLFEPIKPLKDGERIKVNFVFAEREPIDISFLLKDVIPVTPESAMGDMDHSKMDHGSMDHGAMNHGDKKP
ncbi:MAG: hypothetical protein CFE27_12080 [Alphaproteobacteria bacterium PA1]|nr:MAG: hypothetical protein CFE27_12080 [Alphaproteobacteria bacterium PA1]